MGQSSIPVDLFNPGQVFACLGFMEAAEVICGDAEAFFDWSDPTGERFVLRARGEQPPVEAVLEFLERATARAEAVDGSPNIAAWKPGWGPSPVIVSRSSGYPFPDPDSPATLPCLLSDGQVTLRVDHWGDDRATGRDKVKFWAGSGGYPGAALARDALDLVRGRAAASVNAPFSLTAPQSSSFRFDWRRDYIPLDAGFSLNEHTASIRTVGFPLVELLAAVGLAYARPLRREKLTYEYAVIGCRDTSPVCWFPPALLRAALGIVRLPFPTRRFRMRLDSPGKDDRAITMVTEETTP